MAFYKAAPHLIHRIYGDFFALMDIQLQGCKAMGLNIEFKAETQLPLPDQLPGEGLPPERRFSLEKVL